MTVLSLSLLGPFQASLDNEALDSFRTRKVQALLIYLVAKPKAHGREQLLNLLWPGLPETSARSNLRQILYYLRQEIPEVQEDAGKGVPIVIANRKEIRLNPKAGVTVDTWRFESLLESVHAHEHPDLFQCSQCATELQEAIALYRGDFLSDFYLDDSNEFETWAQACREHFRRRALDALGILTTLAIRALDYTNAQAYAERQLEIDNLSESAYRQFMQVLALSGRREQALTLYESCRRALAEELGMAPTTRTTEIYEKIVAGDMDFETSVQRGVHGYELKEQIGEGAHGAIYRAIQPAIGREVAVKVIRRRNAADPDFIRRFEAEAQIVARLEHPHIVPLYDYWRDPNGAYLVMRYMRQGSLLTALKPGPWNTEKAANLLNQISGALSTAHQKGIVHRDLKPGNILLDESGNAYLTDFGIAKDLYTQEQITAENTVVGTLEYTSPEQILSGEISAQSDIYSLGAVIYETLTGEKPFADESIARLLHSQLNNPMPLVSATRADVPTEVDVVLQKATAKKPAERYATTQEMVEAFYAAIGRPVVEGGYKTAEAFVSEVAEIYNPYKGLRAFQEADKDDFFGRDDLVQQLIDRLGGLVNGRESRFLAVVGPSGSGKSSAVKAGLIPALREGALPGSEKWFTVEMVPGSHPLEELELALWPVAVDPPPSLVEPMRRDTRGLLRTLRRILPANGSRPQLLLVIDQFEEMFTLVEDKEQRTFFLDSLLAAIQAPHSPLRLVVTLRADFYDRPLLQKEWGLLLKANTEIVLPLNHSELTWAIREPARRMGVRLDEQLLATVVADVADQPGSLPLLQYALTELFDRRDGTVISKTDYQAINGVQGALASRAEALYEALDRPGREASRQLFLRLVTLGEGSEDTRRRVLRSEVIKLTGDERAMETALERFGKARFLTFDRDPLTRAPTLEVAHEALLREWARLRDWLDESRNDIRLQRMLAAAAAEWQAADREPGFLLRDARLDQFAGWAETTSVALTDVEQSFVKASIAAREARLAAEEDRRRRELEAARQLAESEKARADEQAKAAAGLRQRALMLGGALVIAAVLAVAAIFFAQQSIANAAEAEDNAVAAATSEARAITNLGLANTREAEAVAAEAAAVSAGEEAQAEAVARATAEADAIEQRDVAQEQRETAVEQANLASSREIALQALNTLEGDPELSILLAMEAVSTARTTEAANALHQAVTTSRVRMRLTTNGFVDDVEMSSTGEYIAAADIDNNMAFVWDAVTGQELLQAPTLRFGTSDFGFARVDFNLDGTRLATLNPEDTVSIAIWELPSGDEHSTIMLPLPTDNLTDYALSPDWSQIAVGYIDGSVSVWEIETSRQLYELSAHTAWVRLSYSQNGQRLATVSKDNTAWVWEAATGEALFNVGVNHIEWLSHGEFLSPDGTLLAYSTGPEIHIWNLEDETLTPTSPPTTVLTGQGYNFGISFSADGRRIATSSRNQKVWVWDPLTGEAIVKLNHGLSNAWAVAFSPDGSQLITSDWQGDVRIWDITPQGEEELRTYAIDGIVWDISPDGEKLLTGTAGQNLLGLGSTATVWDIKSGEALFVLEGHTADISRPLFSPDGELLATASQDGTAIIWDANTGEPLQVLDGHDEGFVGGGNFLGVLAIAFNHDGSLVATAGTDKTARIWDVATGEELQVLTGHTMGLTNIAFSPDGQLLATASEESDAFVRIWDVATGTELFSLPPVHADKVWGLAFGNNERILATGGGDGTVKVWYLDLEAGEGHLLSTLIGFSSATWFTAFSPDGRALASSDGMLVKVWDVSSLLNFDSDKLGETINIPELLSSPAGWAFAFNPIDGTLFFNLKGTVRAYTLSTDELMDIAATRVTRSLTEDECKQYLHLETCPETVTVQLPE